MRKLTRQFNLYGLILFFLNLIEVNLKIQIHFLIVFLLNFNEILMLSFDFVFIEDNLQLATLIIYV